MYDTYKVDYDDNDKAIRINGRYFFTFKKSDEMYFVLGLSQPDEEEYQIVFSLDNGGWCSLSYYTYLDFIRMYGFDPKTRKKVC